MSSTHHERHRAPTSRGSRRLDPLGSIHGGPCVARPKCRQGAAYCCVVMDELTLRPFAHLTAPLHVLYRRVMAVFRVSKQRFVVHLRPEDVTEALRGDSAAPAGHEDVQEALSKLAEWGNLRATPDTSRANTVEDFYRTRYLYQLSREGEAAERALEVYEQEIGRRAELQAVALEDIRLRLRALAALPPILTRRWRTVCCWSY